MANERLDPEGTGLDNSRPNPRFDKSEVKEKFKQRLVQMRDSYLKTADDASFMAREADGPMQSRYDTTKTEQAWLANALGGMGENADRISSDWDTTFPSKVSDRAELGALVFLEDLEYGDKDWFYMMPFAGGMSIEIEGESIRGAQCRLDSRKKLTRKRKRSKN